MNCISRLDNAFYFISSNKQVLRSFAEDFSHEDLSFKVVSYYLFM